MAALLQYASMELKDVSLAVHYSGDEGCRGSVYLKGPIWSNLEAL